MRIISLPPTVVQPPSLKLPKNKKKKEEPEDANTVLVGKISPPKPLLKDEEELMGHIAKLRDAKTTSDRARGPIFMVVR